MHDMLVLRPARQMPDGKAGSSFLLGMKNRPNAACCPAACCQLLAAQLPAARFPPALPPASPRHHHLHRHLHVQGVVHRMDLVPTADLPRISAQAGAAWSAGQALLFGAAALTWMRAEAARRPADSELERECH